MRQKGIAAKLPAFFRNELLRIIDSNNQYRIDKVGHLASGKTQRERQMILLMAFGQLYEMGYRLQDPENLGERHVIALIERWSEEGLVANTLHTRISILNAFAIWIGKPGMVRAPVEYLGQERVKRTSIAKENKSWKAKGVRIADVLADAQRLDSRFALLLMLMDSFGLRVKEAIEFSPAKVEIDVNGWMQIYEGTKGGRWRPIPIETERQREVLEMAKSVARAKDGRMRWPGMDFTQSQGHFYRLMAAVGLTRKGLGVTAHGLRYGYAQTKYKGATDGKLSPIEGGDPKAIEASEHRQAAITVSSALGHSRPMGTYYGSYGHQLRRGPRKFAWASSLEVETLTKYDFTHINNLYAADSNNPKVAEVVAVNNGQGA